MPLPAIPLLTHTETVAGVPVTFHALTTGQVEHLQEMALHDPDGTGPQALAWAFDADLAEAKDWIREHTPAVAMELAGHIMRHSGMTPAEGARFPA